tara:strand:+ start:1659 stop:3104 length:1446 start_codon:yes stop_codon:yes gene_type:complete
MINKSLPLLMDQSKKGRKAINLPEIGVEKSILPDKKFLRDSIQLPEVSQLDLIRYFTNLSSLNFSIDTNFYPLGSCTMKYNPKINEQISAFEGFSASHPNQIDENVQGCLEVMYNLQNELAEITGLKSVSLAPLAGAQGEYAGLLIAREYHKFNNNNHKNIALIPDSAHGTNPASAAMAGLNAVTIKTTSEGDIDIADLKEKVSKETAVLMLTLPSTLGLFEPNILEITQIVHDNGGLVYADGANLNALLGITKFGDLGIDICHSNLHKTFSTPHGGGGPGAGPVMVTKKLESFLPYPHIKKENDIFKNYKPENTIGRLNGFSGSFGILLRAYTYIRSLGAGGLKEISENAIINANYIQERLKSHYNLTSSRYCMHETVLSATRQKENGIKALDIAKKLLDEGFHAPTMYFPLIVDEALMIEPTESESKETIDSFIECMIMISELSSSNPEEIINAPINLPVERLDEALAARNPVLSWKKE